MKRRSNTSPILLSLALAMLLSMACSKDSTGETTQDPSPSAATSTGTPAAAPQAAPQLGQSGQPGAAPLTIPAAPADTTKIPDVVARVNGVEIKKGDLLRQAKEMQARFAQMSRGQQVPALDDAFYKQVLDGIVAQTLLIQEASRQGVAVGDAEIQSQLTALKSRFPDNAAFEKELAGQGLTEKTLRDKMRDEATIQKYVSTKLLNGITVSDQDAREFYDKNKSQMQRPERAHLRHILVKVEPTAPAADKEKAKAKAEELLKRAQAGEDFGKLARENSDDPGSKVRDGDLSWYSRGQTVPPFDQAAFALTKPNELSGVVESQFGYHIIQLVEREAAGAVPFEEAKDRITNMLKQREAGQKLQARVEELKKQGKVEVFL